MFLIKFILLFPFSLLYGVIIYIRNRLYDYNILHSYEFHIPVVSIGNLSAGGDGKTPHLEYLIKLLKEKYKIAVLSRGYKRRTKGFVVATDESTYKEIGDEAVQVKQKFKEIPFFVDKNRVSAIKKILNILPDLDIILLDDAFQYRRIKPGLSILVTDYNSPFWSTSLLPLGTLREHSFEYKRSDIVIISKVPTNLSSIERRIIKEKVKLYPYQDIFLSFIEYGDFVPLFPASSLERHKNKYYFENNYTILLFTGIANPKPLEDYLKGNKINFLTIRFADHHEYSKYDILRIVTAFERIPEENKIVLTTEKDVTRLSNPLFTEYFMKIPIYYVPIEVTFTPALREEFNDLIYSYVRKSKIFS